MRSNAARKPAPVCHQNKGAPECPDSDIARTGQLAPLTQPRTPTAVPTVLHTFRLPLSVTQPKGVYSVLTVMGLPNPTYPTFMTTAERDPPLLSPNQDNATVCQL
jgi:hypothetical protein